MYRRDLRDTTHDGYLHTAAVADTTLQVAPDPTSDAIAYAKAREGRSELWLWDGETDTRLTANGVLAMRYGRGDQRWFDWHPDGTHIAYIDAEGTLSTVAVATGETRQLTTHDDPDLAAAYGPNGDRIALVTDAFSRASLAVTDADGGGTVALADDEYLYGQPAWGPDGAVYAVRAPHRSLFDEQAAVIRASVGDDPLATTEIQPLFDREAVRATSVRPNPTGETVAFVHDASGFDAIAVVDTTGGDPETVHAVDGAEVADPAWHPDGDRLAATVTHDASTRLVTVERATGETETLDATGVHTGPRFDGDRLLVVRDTPHQPPTVYDATAGEHVTPSETRGGLDAVVKPETIEYESAGRTIQAVVYPPTDADAPILVHPHGGPTALDMLGFDPRAAYFARLGYCVVMPNYRGSDGYGRAFRMANDGDWGGGDLQDVIGAADAAAEAYDDADGERVGIYGGSGGGLMTINALGNSDRFLAGAAFYGVYDYETFVDDTDDVGWQLMKRELGSLATEIDNYRAASPIRHAEAIDEPTLVLHGEEDARVPISQSEQLVEELEHHGGRYEFRRYDGEQHGFVSQDAFVDAYTRVADLFAKYLRNQPDDGSSRPHETDEPARTSN